jgi:hypothetical protein
VPIRVLATDLDCTLLDGTLLRPDLSLSRRPSRVLAAADGITLNNVQDGRAAMIEDLPVRWDRAPGRGWDRPGPMVFLLTARPAFAGYAEE